MVFRFQEQRVRPDATEFSLNILPECPLSCGYVLVLPLAYLAQSAMEKCWQDACPLSSRLNATGPNIWTTK